MKTPVNSKKKRSQKLTYNFDECDGASVKSARIDRNFQMGDTHPSCITMVARGDHEPALASRCIPQIRLHVRNMHARGVCLIVRASLSARSGGRDLGGSHGRVGTGDQPIYAVTRREIGKADKAPRLIDDAFHVLSSTLFLSLANAVILPRELPSSARSRKFPLFAPTTRIIPWATVAFETGNMASCETPCPLCHPNIGE